MLREYIVCCWKKRDIFFQKTPLKHLFCRIAGKYGYYDTLSEYIAGKYGYYDTLSEYIAGKYGYYDTLSEYIGLVCNFYG